MVHQIDGSVTTGAVYSYEWSSTATAELEKENDILKQRCSFYSDYWKCQYCKFDCKYRQKLTSSTG